MVFNWFRRKFDKSESESESVPDPEQLVAVESEDEPAVEEQQPEIASGEVATDYLAWAKAA